MNQPSDTPEQQLANQILDAQLTEHTFENKVANLQRELTEAREAFRTAADSLVNVSAERDSAVAEVVQWKNRDTYRENLITELRNERDRFRAAQQQAEKERDDIRSRMDGLFGTLKSVQSQRSEAEATIAELRTQLLTAKAQAAESLEALINVHTMTGDQPAMMSEFGLRKLLVDIEELVVPIIANTAASPMMERLRAAEEDTKRMDKLIKLRLIHQSGTNDEGKPVTLIYGHRDSIDGYIAAMTSTQNTQVSDRHAQPSQPEDASGGPLR